MKISDELLAVYAEGNATTEEKNQVRQYLMENPKELESVMMMMDEDYDLEVDLSSEVVEDKRILSEQLSHDICYSAAAFAPNVVSLQRIRTSSNGKDNNTFDQQLGNLLSELDL